MPSKHAILSPSSSKRWLTCPPSARLESMVPSRDTIYTQEGTIAHAIAETILNAHLCFGLKTYLGFSRTMDYVQGAANLDNDMARFYLDEITELRGQASGLGLDFDEMADIVCDKYVAIVWEEYQRQLGEDPGAQLIVEAELKLDDFIPEGFGSSDAVIISEGLLQVFDLKYGKGVRVDAEMNTQMLCYALGAYCGPAELYDIKRVAMHIVQPRLDHHSVWNIFSVQLFAWATNILKPAAEAAFHGMGETVAGEHCKFCRVAAKCPALRNASHAVSNQPVELLSDEEIAAELGRFPQIKSWMDAVETYALNQAMQGETFPGFKMVEGRSLRKITDSEKAIDILKEAGFEESAYLKPRELETISTLEKRLRKKTFNELLGGLVVKPQGKPALVPEDDPRPVFVPDGAASFNDINV